MILKEILYYKIIAKFLVKLHFIRRLSIGSHQSPYEPLTDYKNNATLIFFSLNQKSTTFLKTKQLIFTVSNTNSSHIQHCKTREFFLCSECLLSLM